MFDINKSAAVSILFVEVGCMVDSTQLNDEHLEELEFLVHGEEVGDFDGATYLMGLMKLAKKILKHSGMSELSPTSKSVMDHRKHYLTMMESQRN